MLFRQQENHARKLEQRANNLEHNTSEEQPEYAQQDGIVQLQEVYCYAEHSEQIKNEASSALAPYLSHIQTPKVFRHRNGEEQRNDECDTATASPDSGRHGFDRQ